MKHGNISIFVPHSGCPHQCSFCNQKAITGAQQSPTNVLVEQAIETALRSTAGQTAALEVAFFGGSFTALPLEEQERLLVAAWPYVKSGCVQGVRISTRPDAIDRQRLALLRRYGVTAVELGAQSMDDRVLACNERGHTRQDVVRAGALIRQTGFSLGLQMMTGLYGSTPELDLDTARQLILLKPDTVRIYPTVVLPHTALAFHLAQGRYKPQTLEEAVALCARLVPLFETAGIRVIRLGLHDSAQLRSERLGGAYHPAFGELVENQIYLDRVLALLHGSPAGAYTLYVPPGCISKMKGQKKKNMVLLAAMGYRLLVREDSSLAIKDRALRLVPAQAERNR